MGHITDAAHIQWEWYLYGKTKSEKNLRIISYERKDKDIIVKNESLCISKSFSPKGFYALEIV